MFFTFVSSTYENETLPGDKQAAAGGLFTNVFDFVGVPNLMQPG